LEQIVLRHDNSGEYPLSELDFPEEKKLVQEGRVPLDGLYKSIFKAFPLLKESSPSPSPAAMPEESMISKPGSPASSSSFKSESYQLPIQETTRKRKRADPKRPSKRAKK
jgi:hypothetical protein